MAELRDYKTFKNFVRAGNYDKAFDMYIENQELGQNLSRDEALGMLDYAAGVIFNVMVGILDSANKAATRMISNLENKLGEAPTVEEFSRSVQEVEEH